MILEISFSSTYKRYRKVFVSSDFYSEFRYFSSNRRIVVTHNPIFLPIYLACDLFARFSAVTVYLFLKRADLVYHFLSQIKNVAASYTRHRF